MKFPVMPPLALSSVKVSPPAGTKPSIGRARMPPPSTRLPVTATRSTSPGPVPATSRSTRAIELPIVRLPCSVSVPTAPDPPGCSVPSLNSAAVSVPEPRIRPLLISEPVRYGAHTRELDAMSSTPWFEKVELLTRNSAPPEALSVPAIRFTSELPPRYSKALALSATTVPLLFSAVPPATPPEPRTVTPEPMVSVPVAMLSVPDVRTSVPPCCGSAALRPVSAPIHTVRVPPISSVLPAPSVSPWGAYSDWLPASCTRPSMVTFDSVPLWVLSSGVASLLRSVPPATVPDSVPSPPTPKSPALPMSSVEPALSKRPVRFSVLPACRSRRFSSADLSSVPPRLRTPLSRKIVPVLIHCAPARETVPVPLIWVEPLCSSVPVAFTRSAPAELDALPDCVTLLLAWMSSVPPLARKVPEEVRVSTVTCRVWLAVSACSVPLLRSSATPRGLREP